MGKRRRNSAEALCLAAALLKLFLNLLQAVPTLPNPNLAAGPSIMPMQPANKPYQGTDLADTALAPPHEDD